MRSLPPVRHRGLLALPLALVCGGAAARDGAPTPTPAETPRPEPIRPEPVPRGFRRVTLSPTPSPTATPFRAPRLVAALESEQGEDLERLALFDDGSLVLVRRYQGRGVPRYRKLTPDEVDVVRGVVREALQSKPADLPDRSVAGSRGRKLRLEVASDGGGSRVFAMDDGTAVPLAVGRARAALEDLRGRFFASDVKETAWDPSAVKTGDLLRHRVYRSWYRVVRDDAFERSLELQEMSEFGARMLLSREQLPALFESPAEAGPTPTPGGRR